MNDIHWFHFSPHVSGSFGREDMGTFCEVGGSMFVVPLFESAIQAIEKDELEKQIESIAATSIKEDVYEYHSGGFSADVTVDWHKVIQSSVVAV
jgi:hypothetical protein